MNNELITCPKCDNQIKDGIEVCPYCGNHLEIHMSNTSANCIDTSSFSNNSNSVFIINQDAEKGEKKAKKSSVSFMKGMMLGGALGLVVGVLCTVMVWLIINNGLSEEKINKETQPKSKVSTDTQAGNNTDNSVSNGTGEIEKNDGQISNTESSKNAANTSENEGVISSENLHPVFYSENNIDISMYDCQYTLNASDIRLTLDIKNNSQQIIEVGFSNIKVDDAQINMFMGSAGSYKVGNVSSCYYISLEDLEAAGVTDFANIGCIIYGKDKDGNELFSKDIIIERDAFVPFQ